MWGFGWGWDEGEGLVGLVSLGIRYGLVFEFNIVNF